VEDNVWSAQVFDNLHIAPVALRFPTQYELFVELCRHGISRFLSAHERLGREKHADGAAEGPDCVLFTSFQLLTVPAMVVVVLRVCRGSAGMSMRNARSHIRIRIRNWLPPPSSMDRESAVHW
jgi:hypothetical protein